MRCRRPHTALTARLLEVNFVDGDSLTVFVHLPDGGRPISFPPPSDEVRRSCAIMSDRNRQTGSSRRGVGPLHALGTQDTPSLSISGLCVESRRNHFDGILEPSTHRPAFTPICVGVGPMRRHETGWRPLDADRTFLFRGRWIAATCETDRACPRLCPQRRLTRKKGQEEWQLCKRRIEIRKLKKRGAEP
jgi:hypothetical protein